MSSKIMMMPVALLLGSMASCQLMRDDYNISRNYTQTVDLSGIHTVILQCYCQNRTIQTGTVSGDIKTLTLDIRLNLGSRGYHGQQKKPDVLPPDALEFVSQKQGDTLILQSQENTYMHHFFLVNKLRVTLPPDIQLHIQPLTSLEGRQVR